MGELSLVKTLDKFRIMPLILLAAAAEIAAASYGIIITITIALVILAILEHYMDDILDFISSIGNGITQMATIVWEWTSTTAIPCILNTATGVWDDIAIGGIEIKKVDQNLRKARAKTKTLTEATTAQPKGNSNIKTHGVYLIFAKSPGPHNDYDKGGKVSMPIITKNGSPLYLYKIGITIQSTLRKRYNNKKAPGASGYIANELNNTLIGFFLGRRTEENPYNYTRLTARLYEKIAIISYKARVGRKPPGNGRYT